MSFDSLPLTVGLRPYDDPDVTRMVEAVQAEYVVMYGGPDAAAVDPDEFAPPAGALYVGALGGEAVAMAGWRRLSATVAELKRMYVDPRVRGRGLSRAMLEVAERGAAQAGVVEFVLNTGPVQQVAIALYERSGYVPSAPFGHYADHGGALFYAKRLDTRDEARPPERTGLVEGAPTRRDGPRRG